MDNYLLDEDPSRIEHHWQRLYRGGFYRGGPILMSAISGIDQALWDIKAKRFDAPLYELLGGAPATESVSTSGSVATAPATSARPQSKRLTAALPP